MIISSFVELSSLLFPLSTEVELSSLLFPMSTEVELSVEFPVSFSVEFSVSFWVVFSISSSISRDFATIVTELAEIARALSKRVASPKITSL
ncbi:MAG: Uncharacterised protein [Methanobacteriota archaeon]|nr:MAG: Uncharacterised protein [Euryarchaeota archaeon]